MKNIKTKSLILVLIVAAGFMLAVILIYPNIEFKKGGKLYSCSFSEDFSEFEENPSFNELYFYNEKHDISLKSFEVKNFLCFYVFSFEYIEGDFRETQFLLKEEYIKRWLDNAEIKENEFNIDIAEIIKGKTPKVANKRYLGNDYEKSITYVLDGKWETLYVFECDGLTVIQVGSTDECPKFIAYK